MKLFFKKSKLIFIINFVLPFICLCLIYIENKYFYEVSSDIFGNSRQEYASSIDIYGYGLYPDASAQNLEDSYEYRGSCMGKQLNTLYTLSTISYIKTSHPTEQKKLNQFQKHLNFLQSIKNKNEKCVAFKG